MAVAEEMRNMKTAMMMKMIIQGPAMKMRIMKTKTMTMKVMKARTTTMKMWTMMKMSMMKVKRRKNKMTGAVATGAAVMVEGHLADEEALHPAGEVSQRWTPSNAEGSQEWEAKQQPAHTDGIFMKR
jgi:hypothetical protein